MNTVFLDSSKRFNKNNISTKMQKITVDHSLSFMTKRECKDLIRVGRRKGTSFVSSNFTSSLEISTLSYPTNRETTSLRTRDFEIKHKSLYTYFIIIRVDITFCVDVPSLMSEDLLKPLRKTLRQVRNNEPMQCETYSGKCHSDLCTSR